MKIFEVVDEAESIIKYSGKIEDKPFETNGAIYRSYWRPKEYYWNFEVEPKEKPIKKTKYPFITMGVEYKKQKDGTYRFKTFRKKVY